MDYIEEVLVSLRRIIRATDLHSKYLAKTIGLTTPQMVVLQTINIHDYVTIGELANHISLSQATVTTILDRLEKRNLIYRERSKQDKRKVHVHLTKEALTKLINAPIPIQEQFTKQFSNLEDWEKTMIISSLQRIEKMMDAQNIDAAPVLDIGVLDRESMELEHSGEFNEKKK